MRADGRIGCLAFISAATAIVAAAACGAPQATPRASLRPEIGEVPVDLRSDYQSFVENCSKCHDLERALAAPVTDNRHWDVYVAKMMRTAGSAISPDEAPHILRFLYWYTGRKTGRASAKEAVSVEPASTIPAHSSSAPPSKEAADTPRPAPQPEPQPSEVQGESTP